MFKFAILILALFTIAQSLQTQEVDVDADTLKECKDAYAATTNELLEKQQEEIEICLNTTRASMEELDKELTDTRMALKDNANTSCQKFKDCEEAVEILDFFSCYADAAKTNINKFYYMESTSLKEAIYVNTVMVNIIAERTTCISTSEREYIEGMSQAYTEYTECVKGLQKPE